MSRRSPSGLRPVQSGEETSFERIPRERSVFGFKSGVGHRLNIVLTVSNSQARRVIVFGEGSGT